MATAGPGGQELPVDGHEAQELPVGDDLIEAEVTLIFIYNS